MAIRVVQLGTNRLEGEGLRLGTVRRPPRGVPRAEYARRNYYDVWLPDIAPSAELVDEARAAIGSAAGWRRFEKRYRSELKGSIQARLIALLAALSQHADFSIGCYCEDERRCHRSILAQVLRDHGGKVV